MKLANNLLSATAVAITSEAMALGVKAGLDPSVMLQVINAGSGRNSATLEKFPRAVLTGTFNVGFAARLAHKDVRLCLEEAERHGVPMVVGSSVREMLLMTTAIRGQDADYATWPGSSRTGPACRSAPGPEAPRPPPGKDRPRAGPR